MFTTLRGQVRLPRVERGNNSIREKTREKKTGNQVVNVSGIMYEFYSKEMASKAVINSRSALSWGTKRTVLTQEVLRVLLNCSKLSPWERVVENVNEMVLRMQYSEYSEKFRYEVVNSAFKAYKTRKKADQERERLLYRPREWKREERDQEKARKRSNWYKKGGNEAVIFVPATPNSQLQRRYQKEIKRQGFKIKVVEKSGVTIKKLL